MFCQKFTYFTYNTVNRHTSHTERHGRAHKKGESGNFIAPVRSTIHSHAQARERDGWESKLRVKKCMMKNSSEKRTCLWSMNESDSSRAKVARTLLHKLASRQQTRNDHHIHFHYVIQFLLWTVVWEVEEKFCNLTIIFSSLAHCWRVLTESAIIHLWDYDYFKLFS